MSKEDVLQKGMLLKEQINFDANKGSDLLRDFADEYSSNSKLKFKSSLIKSGFNNNPDQNLRGILIKQAEELIDEIVFNYSKNALPKIVNAVEVQKKFLQLNPERRLLADFVGLTKSYPSQNFKLNNINLELREGEITGVVGINAQGKSTLLKIIAGEINMDSGKTRFLVYDNTKKNNNWAALKERVAFLPQELPKVHGTVEQSIMLSASAHGVFGEDNEYKTQYIIHRLGLGEMKNTNYANLSSGYKLRLMLARILVWEPKIIVLDEPLANLDILVKTTLLNDLRYLANSLSNPLSIIISSHDVEEVESVADNMIILEKGAVIYNGKTTNIGGKLIGNEFEIRSPMSLDDLRQKFSTLNLISLQPVGSSFIFTTTPEIHSREVLRYCIENEIDISYFNDITHSSKRMILTSKSS